RPSARAAADDRRLRVAVLRHHQLPCAARDRRPPDDGIRRVPPQPGPRPLSAPAAAQRGALLAFRRRGLDLRRRSHLPFAAVVAMTAIDPQSQRPVSSRRPGWRAMVAPPIAWLAQGTIGWFIAAHSCADETRRIAPATARALI